MSKSKNLILALAGPQGSGKTEIIKFLKDHHKFVHISIEGVLKEFSSGHLGITEFDPVYVNHYLDKIPKDSGHEFFLKKMLAMAQQKTCPVVLDAVWLPAEYQYLIREDVKIIAVEAVETVRYQRMVSRYGFRGSFATFQDLQKREQEYLNPILKKANLKITMNDHRDFQGIEKQVEDCLRLLDRYQSV